MRPVFTIHGGEYIFANEFGKRYPELDLWIPLDDDGIDFLITSKENRKTLSIQVKFSRDFNLLQINPNIRTNLKSLGWFHLNRAKLQNSKADFWVLLTYEGVSKTTDFFFIKPKTLLQRFSKLNRNGTYIDSYLWVMAHTNKAFETRGLNSALQSTLISGNYHNRNRDFTIFLDRWDVIKKRFK